MAIKHVLRKLVNLLFDEDNSNDSKIESSPISSSSYMKGSSGRIGEGSTGLNITIYPAFGGKVVQFNTYDHQRDRMTGGLYIITDNENLGEELGQIITREQLSK